jgi:hypothetical protein
MNGEKSRRSCLSGKPAGSDAMTEPRLPGFCSPCAPDVRGESCRGALATATRSCPGTLAGKKTLAALKFKPMPDTERHHLQGYGTFQRQQFKRDGVNPWLHTCDEVADGQEDPLSQLARMSGWDRL